MDNTITTYCMLKQGFIFYCIGRIECVDILFKSGADIACKDKKVFGFL